MDMDDVHNASITHLGAVTIPAALAVGQEASPPPGGEVLAAIAAGYEIGARVGEAINPGSYHYWHTTGVVGALCSAVAAGKLMGLDREKLLHAIGSAGTQAAGLWQFLEDGAMSKTLHTANGTLCGLRSARLAALGFTAAEETAVGASIVKTEYENIIHEGKQEVIISTCCHSVNTLVEKYYPEVLPYLATVLSPMQAHCQKIKQEHPGVKTVFIGPCISKKSGGRGLPRHSGLRPHL